MNRLLSTIGMMPAAIVGVWAGSNLAAPPADQGASDFAIGLGSTGHLQITRPPKAANPVQGFNPKASGEVIEFEAVAYDIVQVGAVGPQRTFYGKFAKFDLEAVIIHEYKRNCKKIEERRPYREDDYERGPTLTLGDQVKLVVEVTYLQDPQPVQLFATFDKPVILQLKDSARIKVRLNYNPDDVAFAERPITDAERSMYVTPEVERLKRERPSYRDVRSSNERVEPGDLSTLSVAVSLTRDS